MGGHTACINSLVIVPGDLYAVTAADDMTVRVWSLQDYRSAAVLGGTEEVYAIAVSRISGCVVCGGKTGTLQVWNLEKKKIEFGLEGHTAPVRTIAVTDDGRFAVSGSADKNIRVWNLKEKRLETIIKGHLSQLINVQILQGDMYILSSSGDGEVRLWSLQGRLQKIVLRGHKSSVFALVVARDNKYIVSGSKDKTICVWDTQDKLQEPDTKGIKYHGPEWHDYCETVETVVFEKDWLGYEFVQETLQYLGGPERWYPEYILWKQYAGIVSVTAEDLQGRCVIAAPESVGNGNLKNKFEDDAMDNLVFKPNAIVIDKENQFLVFDSEDMTLRVWDLIEKRESTILVGHSAAISSLAVDKNNRYIVSAAEDHTFRIWDIKKLK